jgi:hypothetical protein
MTVEVACKSTVHFSTSFSTTRTLFRKQMGNVVFCKGVHAVWACPISGNGGVLTERDGDGAEQRYNSE